MGSSKLGARLDGGGAFPWEEELAEEKRRRQGASATRGVGEAAFHGGAAILGAGNYDSDQRRRAPISSRGGRRNCGQGGFF